jgi:hypothetical protein
MLGFLFRIELVWLLDFFNLINEKLCASLDETGTALRYPLK